ncbi:MAG: AAA family ATPase [Chitinophagaceae bacterium]
MKLIKAQLENFRSIKTAELNFKIPFKILVGKNESGKSNILKALSLLDKDTLPSKEDLREGINDFDKKISTEVTFEFKLDETELNEVYQKLETLLLTNNGEADKKTIASIDDIEHNLFDLCLKYNAGLYEVNIATLQNRYTYWSLKDKWKSNPELKWNPGDEDQTYGPVRQKYKDYKIIDISVLADSEKDSFIELSDEKVHDLICNQINTYIKNHHPQVINWKYDEKNLLPDSINIATFVANPSSFSPLKTMFELAEIKNIKEAITTYQNSGSFHKLNNFLEKIADKTTKHFREVWKEYKNIEFTLNLNGDTIVTGIKETNTYSFQQRSDGFKRFVTFLLMVSATYKTENLKNAILLIDEPDISLHPSGIRYLRDELIRISKHNTVCASTHSIFLIDNTNLNRHYIIKKENEVTSIEEVDEHNIINEEVIYNALGFSFYETLRHTNLVFEGWRDKELFRKSLEKNAVDIKELKDFFKDFGFCHINGVKEAKSIAPILELSGRNFFIISDNDDVANARKKDFVKEKTHGEWLTYKDCFDECKAITGEDFLKKEHISAAINSIKKIKKELAGVPKLEDSQYGVINEINRWLEKECLIKDPQERKDIIGQIKEILFESLKHTNIDAAYYDFLRALKTKVEKQIKSTT